MSDQPIEGRCGRKRRRTNPPDYCERYPLNGRTGCKDHGGKTPRGLESPHFKTGRYCRHLPEEFKAAYVASLADPNLLDAREPIAILDAQVKRCGQRLEDLDTPEFRKTAVKKMETLTVAHNESNMEELTKAIGDLGQWLEKGGREDGAFKDLVRAAETVCAVVQKEGDQELKRDQVVNAKVLVGLFGVIAGRLMDELDGKARTIALRIVQDVIPEVETAKGA